MRLTLTPLMDTQTSPLLKSFTITAWGYKGALASKFVNGGTGQVGAVGEAPRPEPRRRVRGPPRSQARDRRRAHATDDRRRDRERTPCSRRASRTRRLDACSRESRSSVHSPSPTRSGKSPFGLVGRYDHVKPSVSSTGFATPPPSSNAYHFLIGRPVLRSDPEGAAGARLSGSARGGQRCVERAAEPEQGLLRALRHQLLTATRMVSRGHARARERRPAIGLQEHPGERRLPAADPVDHSLRRRTHLNPRTSPRDAPRRTTAGTRRSASRARSERASGSCPSRRRRGASRRADRVEAWRLRSGSRDRRGAAGRRPSRRVCPQGRAWPSRRRFRESAAVQSSREPSPLKVCSNARHPWQRTARRETTVV